MTMHQRIACALLAAGSSSRLGRPKQLLLWNGVPLVHHLAQQALSSRAESVAVVVGAERGAVAAALGDLPVSEIVNREFDEGMASSVRAAVNWAQSRAFDGLILMTVDQPLVSSPHLDRLIERHRGHGRRVASEYTGVRGVPALFPSSDFEALLALSGDTGARALLRETPDIDAIQLAGGALDIDCESDLESLAPLSDAGAENCAHPPR